MRYVATVTQEGEHWLAEFPDAPGCQTFADNEAELHAAAKEALEGWLESWLVTGDAPPRPKRRVTKAKFVVDVDPALAIAIELRWARLDAKLTQTELAKRAGVSQPQIAKLERPGENPTVGTLAKVAAALGGRFEARIVRA